MKPEKFLIVALSGALLLPAVQAAPFASGGGGNEPSPCIDYPIAKIIGIIDNGDAVVCLEFPSYVSSPNAVAQVEMTATGPDGALAAINYSFTIGTATGCTAGAGTVNQFSTNAVSGATDYFPVTMTSSQCYGTISVTLTTFGAGVTIGPIVREYNIAIQNNANHSCGITLTACQTPASLELLCQGPGAPTSSIITATISCPTSVPLVSSSSTELVQNCGTPQTVTDTSVNTVSGYYQFCVEYSPTIAVGTTSSNMVIKEMFPKSVGSAANLVTNILNLNGCTAGSSTLVASSLAFNQEEVDYTFPLTITGLDCQGVLGLNTGINGINPYFQNYFPFHIHQNLIESNSHFCGTALSTAGVCPTSATILIQNPAGQSFAVAATVSGALTVTAQGGLTVTVSGWPALIAYILSYGCGPTQPPLTTTAPCKTPTMNVNSTTKVSINGNVTISNASSFVFSPFTILPLVMAIIFAVLAEFRNLGGRMRLNGFKLLSGILFLISASVIAFNGGLISGKGNTLIGDTFWVTMTLFAACGYQIATFFMDLMHHDSEGRSIEGGQ